MIRTITRISLGGETILPLASDTNSLQAEPMPQKPIETELILFDRKHWVLIGIILTVFVLGVLFRIHGYSTSMWRDYIDGSEKSEILAGEPRAIRSDDWAVEIPLMLAQWSHEPRFPLINENIGMGANMLTHSKNPIWHPVTLFRPTVWGFFIGPGIGLAWMWWSMVLGLFYGCFLLLMLISRSHFDLSVLGSLLLVFSPFFQFWSFHKAEIPIFMTFVFVALTYLLYSKHAKSIMANGLLLGWATACFGVSFLYPPFQIACFYLLLFLIAGFAIERHSDFSVRRYWGLRLGAIVIAAIISFRAFLSFYISAEDVINIMSQTVYPGDRFCLGGDLPAWAVFRQTFLSLLFYSSLRDIDWSQLGNRCESSSFIFFFPLIAIALFWHWLKQKKISDWIGLSMVGYCAIMFFYIIVGFSPALSKYTLFYQMQGNRALIGLGIANTILLVSFLSRKRAFTDTERLVQVCLWTLFLFVMGLSFARYFDQFSIPYVLATALVCGGLSYCFLVPALRKPAFAILVVSSMVATFWFNPIVVGGTTYFYENPVSKTILHIDEAEAGETRWAVFGHWVFPNLFRILGVNCANGTHPYPQLALWEGFDASQKYRSEYNRFAHVSFQAETNGSIRFHSPSPDQLFVHIDPSSRVLHEMGITHLMVIGEQNQHFKDVPGYFRIDSVGDKVVYQLKNG
jgi:hypothetical protein